MFCCILEHLNWAKPALDELSNCLKETDENQNKPMRILCALLLTFNVLSFQSGSPPPPHPTGIVLNRPDYYTLPALDELTECLEDVEDEDGNKQMTCPVENFVVGREGYGNVMFPGVSDVAGLNLDEIGEWVYLFT